MNRSNREILEQARINAEKAFKFKSPEPVKENAIWPFADNDITRSGLELAQEELEKLYDKNQAISVLRNEFREVTDDPFYLDVLVQAYLHKWTPVPVLVGILSPKWGSPQEVADKLMQAAKDDMINYIHSKRKFQYRWHIEAETERAIALYQFPLPMVTPPLKIKANNKGTGYLSRKGPVVTKAKLKDIEDKDLYLDHLNKVNSVPLQINAAVVASAQGKRIMPVPRDKETQEEYDERREQAEKFYKNSLEVIEAMLTISDKFWLTYWYDRRGRFYCKGYHLDTQGDDYSKAILELANEEILT